MTYWVNDNNHEKLRSSETKSGSLGGPFIPIHSKIRVPTQYLGFFFFEPGLILLGKPQCQCLSTSPESLLVLLKLFNPLAGNSITNSITHWQLWEKSTPECFAFLWVFCFSSPVTWKEFFFLIILSSLFSLSGGLIQFTYRITEVEILHSLFNPIRFSFPLLQWNSSYHDHFSVDSTGAGQNPHSLITLWPTSSGSSFLIAPSLPSSSSSCPASVGMLYGSALGLRFSEYAHLVICIQFTFSK